jgi:hypothetical protein
VTEQVLVPFSKKERSNPDPVNRRQEVCTSSLSTAIKKERCTPIVTEQVPVNAGSLLSRYRFRRVRDCDLGPDVCKSSHGGSYILNPPGYVTTVYVRV